MMSELCDCSVKQSINRVPDVCPIKIYGKLLKIHKAEDGMVNCDDRISRKMKNEMSLMALLIEFDCTVTCLYYIS